MKNKIKKIIAIFISLMLIFTFAGCGEKEAESENSPYIDREGDENINTDDMPEALIVIENYGQVKIKLDTENAPITVANFIELANSGFYDGLTFHRIMEDFVIQGGDPKGDGTGGSDKTIKGEFIENGVANKISHNRGVISMARRSNDYDSATSQFFIVLSDDAKPSLDKKYAAFGYVTEGMDIIDKIVEEIKPSNVQTGFVAKSKQPIIRCIEVYE